MPPSRKSRPAATLIRHPAPVRIIESDLDVLAGIEALRRKCDVLRRVHGIVGDPPLRRRAPGFDGLARIIVGQQVSVASANAIWARLEVAVVPLTASRMSELSDEVLFGAGLSRPKVRTLRAVVAAVGDGLDLTALATMPEDDARAALTSISGIGPWTADVYLMFCVGNADVFAPGDLALQAAAALAFDLPERPDALALATLAKRWRPWRGVAARLLWHFYAHQKTKPGLPV